MLFERIKVFLRSHLSDTTSNVNFVQVWIFYTLLFYIFYIWYLIFDVWYFLYLRIIFWDLFCLILKLNNQHINTSIQHLFHILLFFDSFIFSFQQLINNRWVWHALLLVLLEQWFQHYSSFLSKLVVKLDGLMFSLEWSIRYITFLFFNYDSSY